MKFPHGPRLDISLARVPGVLMARVYARGRQWKGVVGFGSVEEAGQRALRCRDADEAFEVLTTAAPLRDGPTMRA
ncbi:hypothetical protein [Paludisphaera mucosa]|uniref:WGR domain-containing protein n=1 Tax=Paludisphaera mucosa TaxID=3030827 RepID=A0ABT6FKV8_9BACT|nr:hypothetical protein [Paludisphaera mucosa]MDG3008144.1 hypothetical protein [Paludisphaera mucosa]